MYDIFGAGNLLTRLEHPFMILSREDYFGWNQTLDIYLLDWVVPGSCILYLFCPVNSAALDL